MGITKNPSRVHTLQHNLIHVYSEVIPFMFLYFQVLQSCAHLPAGSQTYWTQKEFGTRLQLFISHLSDWAIQQVSLVFQGTMLNCTSQNLNIQCPLQCHVLYSNLLPNYCWLLILFQCVPRNSCGNYLLKLHSCFKTAFGPPEGSCVQLSCVETWYKAPRPGRKNYLPANARWFNSSAFDCVFLSFCISNMGIIILARPPVLL